MMAGALCAGCNNNGNGIPTGPSGFTGIMVSSSSDFMPRGATETFSATATTTGGGTQAVATGVWGSDAPGVVQITPAGLATAMSPGLATVFVDFAGLRGTKLIRVLSSFAGEFAGSYTVGSCMETGEWIDNACGPVFTPGSALPLAFLFAQSGATLTGQTALGGIVSPSFSATVREDGGVTVQVTAAFNDVDLGLLMFAQTWELRSDQAGQITGTLHFVATSNLLTGEATVDATIANATQIGTALTGWRDALGDERAGPLDEVIRRIRQ
jgi:hypothetical protein